MACTMYNKHVSALQNLLSTPIVVDCGRPPFAFFSGADTTATTVGTVITYTCFSGRRLVGDRQRTCLASGEWSGDTPQCERTYTVCVLPVHSLDGTR